VCDIRNRFAVSHVRVCRVSPGVIKCMSTIQGEEDKSNQIILYAPLYYDYWRMKEEREDLRA
jgi:hypothetical protein